NDRAVTLLPNGFALSTGGSNTLGVTNGTLLYNPLTGTWQTGSPLLIGRSGHSATILKNGQVLVAGRSINSGWAPDCELYDSATATWSATGSLNGLRYHQTSTLLPSGKVLVAGGVPPVDISHPPYSLT